MRVDGSMWHPPRCNAFSQQDRLLHCAEWAWSRGQPIHFISSRNQGTVGKTERTEWKNMLSTQEAELPGLAFMMHLIHILYMHSAYLLIVAQLVVQNDAVGLFRLWPRQREAIHGGADLVHDGNYGGSCTAQTEHNISTFLNHRRNVRVGHSRCSAGPAVVADAEVLLLLPSSQASQRLHWKLNWLFSLIPKKDHIWAAMKFPKQFLKPLCTIVKHSTQL